MHHKNKTDVKGQTLQEIMVYFNGKLDKKTIYFDILSI